MPCILDRHKHVGLRGDNIVLQRLSFEGRRYKVPQSRQHHFALLCRPPLFLQLYFAWSSFCYKVPQHQVLTYRISQESLLKL